jgi:hypothetical protein
VGTFAFGAMLAGASAAAIYWLLHPYAAGRKRSAQAAGAAGLLAAGLLAAPWPDKPLAAVLRENAEAEWRPARILREIRSRRRAVAFRRASLARFGEPLDPVPAGARLDRESGMIWGEALPLVLPDYSDASWKRATAACAAQPPAGAWALPSMAEFLKAKNRGADLGSRRWYATVFVPDMELSLMGVFGAGTASAAFGVRCVARSPAAPAEGYPFSTNEDVLSALKP